jgi:hypothetical protein
MKLDPIESRVRGSGGCSTIVFDDILDFGYGKSAMR